ncbi:MAG TPA: hypothetical protein DCG33_06115, partial [Prevotellaceae bacterium]|nr:hypothetical protein [Prevotellaceae bacterium]
MSQTIQVNATPNELSMPTLFFSQGDVGREFQIEVVSSEGYSIPSGATVKITATKPSGFGFSVNGIVSNNTVTFTSTTEMTDEAGRFLAELEITSGSDIIGTANFYMSGEVNPHPEGTTDGSQETIIPELTLLIERAEAAANTAVEDAIEAANVKVNEILDNLPTEVTDLKNDLDSTVLDDISLAWEQGSFRVADGAKQSASWIIRAQIDPSVEFITPDSSSYVSVIAFNGSTYVGWWNGSGFEKTELWYPKTLRKSDYYVDGYTFWVVGKARNNAGINPTYSSHFTIKSNAITGIEPKLFKATSLAWEQGGFVIATGAKASYGYVIRCSNIPDDV